MKPVYQTKFGNEGNCLQACIASIFEIELTTVPAFMDEPAWMNQIIRYLHPFGLYLDYHSAERFHPPYGCYHLVWGISPRGLHHSCVGWNDAIAHDPHPEGGGLVEITEYGVFVATLRPQSLKQYKVGAS